MAEDDRYFVYRDEQGDETEETGVFTGRTPRQSALKAARRYAEDASEVDPTEIKLRERGTDKVHIYNAWTWVEDAPEEGPDWLPEEVTKSNVSKKGIQHLE